MSLRLTDVSELGFLHGGGYGESPVGGPHSSSYVLRNAYTKPIKFTFKRMKFFSVGRTMKFI